MHRAAFTDIVSLVAKRLTRALTVISGPALTAKPTDAQAAVERVHLGYTPSAALLVAQRCIR